MFQTGRIIQLLYLLSSFILVILLTRMNFTPPKMRTIVALDAMEEVVGRGVEMGRPIHVSPGTPSLGEGVEAQTVVGLTIVGHIARLCARFGARCIATAKLPELYPMLQQIVKEAYIAEGKPEDYIDDDVRFLSDQINAYASAVQGIIERENCVGNIVIGRAYGASFMLFARATVGGEVIQIGGTGHVANNAHLAATCDYILLTEELFAAQAYITQDPNQLRAVFTQDIFKAISFVLLIAGSLLTMAGISAIENILKM